MDSPSSIPTASVPPSQDERIMAALSHAAIILSLLGLVVPVVMWVTQKDKSRYVAFQALQAIALQLIRLVGFFIGMGCYMATIFSTVFMQAASSSSRTSGFPTAMLIPFATLGVLGVFGLFFFLYAIVGAVMTLQGKDFRYFLIGDWVEQFMKPASPDR
jgi:uncharacterized Tic20 family protein